MNGKIDHKGIIEHIDGNHIQVVIVQSSACSSCQAKAICSSAESKEKRIDLYDSNASSYHVGESVTVCSSSTMGRDAVFLAFVVPLLLIIVWMFCAMSLLRFDELSAIGTLVLLISAYYVVLGFNKKKISKRIYFWIERQT